jgi:hypothetical protein
MFNNKNNESRRPILRMASETKTNARILDVAHRYITDEFREKYLNDVSEPVINDLINKSINVEKNLANNNEKFKFRGKSSTAVLYKFPKGDMYVVRITPRKNATLYKRIGKEIDVYKLLQSNPIEARQFISELVYADALIAGGKEQSYFIFKYEEGLRLDEFIKKYPNMLSATEVLKIYNHLLEAINFIGNKGIVHRDIKPENIWFSIKRNIPLLFDFDASCEIENCSSAEFVGTKKYASPSAKKLPLYISGFGNMKEMYNYSPIYDKYSALLILEKDLINLVKSKERVVIEKRIAEDKDILTSENMAKFKKIVAGSYATSRMQQMGNERIGIMNPTWGGANCGCIKQPKMQLPIKVSLNPLNVLLKGGACPCQAVPKMAIPMGDLQREGYRGGYREDSAKYTRKGGYRATKKNLKYLKKLKRGESIGFTMISSLKSKGLIPRSNGTKKVSPKYRRYIH